MQKIFSLILVTLLSAALFAQTTVKTFMHDGQNRQYRIFVPSSYNGHPVPVVMAFHGMGDNSANFSGIGLNTLANRDTFITIYPDALVDPVFQASGWNCGVGVSGFYVNSTVDDIGFVNRILDSLSVNYAIDTNRVYATGFSLGGFFAERLACELNNRIAAIASVSGTIGVAINCNPGRAVPVMHIHGTADSTITYAGGFNIPGLGTFKVGMSVAELINHWTGNNDCQNTPDTTNVPNVGGYSIDQIHYPACDAGSEFLHYKVYGLGHNWISNYYPNEIWEFLRKHEKPQQTVAARAIKPVKEIQIYPNPAAESVYINLKDQQVEKILLTDLSGKVLYEHHLPTQHKQITIPLKDISNGLYLLRMQIAQQWVAYKILKQM